MESLYSNEVRAFVNSQPWPKGLVFEIREDDDPAPHLNIIFFRDNWITLTGEQQVQVTNIVKAVMFKLWNDNIPCYTGKMESVLNG